MREKELQLEGIKFQSSAKQNSFSFSIFVEKFNWGVSSFSVFNLNIEIPPFDCANANSLPLLHY